MSNAGKVREALRWAQHVSDTSRDSRLQAFVDGVLARFDALAAAIEMEDARQVRVDSECARRSQLRLVVDNTRGETA